MRKVTDPNILAQYNESKPEYKKVTDPNVLRQYQMQQQQEKPTTGFPGIWEDIKESGRTAPAALGNALYAVGADIPGFGVQLATEPDRIATNAFFDFGQGLKEMANFLPNLANYGLRKGGIESQFPTIPENLGIKEAAMGKQQPGDLLTESAISALPFFKGASLFNKFSKLSNAKKLAAIAPAQAIGANQDPLHAELMASFFNSLGLGAHKVSESEPGRYIRNKILDKAEQAYAKNEAFSPNETSRNVLQNYVGISGEQMPVNFGVTSGYGPAADIYNASSKMPFSGGRNQKFQVGHELQQKSEAKAKINVDKKVDAWKKILADNGIENKDIQNKMAEDLAEHQELTKTKKDLINDQNKLDSDLQKANPALNKLAYKKSVLPEEKITEDVNKLYKDRQKESKELYQPANDFKVDLRTMANPSDFKNYKLATREHALDARGLEQAFGEDKALGRQISSEIKRGQQFFSSQHIPHNVADRTNPALTLKNVTDHIKELQKFAADAKNAGNRKVAADLNEMARGLKEDTKNILRKGGHNEVAEAIEKADANHIQNVLPFYGNSELRNIIYNKNYLGDPYKVAQAVHDPNAKAILQGLPDAAKNHFVFELMTKGKYDINNLSSMDPLDMANAYQRLPAKTRRAIASHNPQANAHFENLTNTIDSFKNNQKELISLDRQINELDKVINNKKSSNKEVEKARKEKKESEENLNKVIMSKFAKPKIKNPSTVDIAHNLNPLKAGGFGMQAAAMGLYGFGHLSLAALSEGLGVSMLIARRINKVLTDPKLTQKYIEGARFEKGELANKDMQKKIKVFGDILRNGQLATWPVANQQRKEKK